MSLLAEIMRNLEANSDLVVSKPEGSSILESLIKVEIAVAPNRSKTPQQLSRLLNELLPMEPYRVYDFFGKAADWVRYGQLCFREQIGTERITRTYTVDDALYPGTETFSIGRQRPITRPVKRDITITLYPSTEATLARSKFRSVA